MFVPLHDDNPLNHISFHYVTVGLIAANVLVFALFQAGFVFRFGPAFAASFGIIPAELTGNGARVPVPGGVPERLTLLTYMFLHGGWAHLLGNMLFLWVFGDNVEDALGHFRFLVFYLLCGVAAGYAHSLAIPLSNQPLVGASGAVAGVIAAYLMLHPHVKVWILVAWRIPLRITALWALGGWIALQFLMLLTDKGSEIAWWAHIGGLAAGALLVVFLRRPGIPLFNRAQKS